MPDENMSDKSVSGGGNTLKILSIIILVITAISLVFLFMHDRNLNDVSQTAESVSASASCNSTCPVDECDALTGTDKQNCLLSCFAGKCGNEGAKQMAEKAGKAGIGCVDDGICNEFCAGTDINCPEAICDDSIDNDGDLLVDCTDNDCNGVDSCEFAIELSCTDGFDNDGDELIDSADPDCGVPACTQGASCANDAECGGAVVDRCAITLEPLGGQNDCLSVQDFDCVEFFGSGSTAGPCTQNAVIETFCNGGADMGEARCEVLNQEEIEGGNVTAEFLPAAGSCEFANAGGCLLTEDAFFRRLPLTNQVECDALAVAIASEFPGSCTFIQSGICECAGVPQDSCTALEFVFNPPSGVQQCVCL